MLLAGLVALAVVAMVIDRRAMLRGGRDLSGPTGVVLDVAAPVQKLLAWPFETARNVWQHYVSVLDVEDENVALRSRIATLEEENLQLREALVASGRLGRIAEIRDQFEVPMLPAELVGVDASPWFRSVLVDRGRGHGVRSGMPVISEHGLVGLVTATANSASKAMLVLDRQSAVDGIVQRSRSRGIVRGARHRRARLRVRGARKRRADRRRRDLSGLGGVHPKGIRIGEVTSVSAPGAGLLQSAKVTPSVDFGRLEQVFVMLRRGPTMELLYGSEHEVGAAGLGGPAAPVERATP